jgi:hypothetical protein
VKAQKAAEQLVGARDKIKARIAELERKAAGAVEPLATVGAVGQPTLPDTEELEELRQLTEAERAADAARLRWHRRAAAAVERAVARRTDETSIAAEVRKWNEFSERLFADEHAERERETS